MHVLKGNVERVQSYPPSNGKNFFKKLACNLLPNFSYPSCMHVKPILSVAGRQSVYDRLRKKESMIVVRSITAIRCVKLFHP